MLRSSASSSRWLNLDQVGLMTFSYDFNDVDLQIINSTLLRINFMQNIFKDNRGNSKHKLTLKVDYAIHPD